jgi:hypothetical protein
MSSLSTVPSLHRRPLPHCGTTAAGAAVTLPQDSRCTGAARGTGGAAAASRDDHVGVTMWTTSAAPAAAGQCGRGRQMKRISAAVVVADEAIRVA